MPPAEVSLTSPQRFIGGLYTQFHLIASLLTFALCGGGALSGWAGTTAPAGPYFEDGYLGLTQAELHDKLGPPQAVRDRKAALRVFNYYSHKDWENYSRS
jgi:hypothetical protein